MKKICVIFTGGTIGSKLEGGFVSPNAQNASRLINGYLKSELNTDKLTGDDFYEMYPVSMLSENVQKEDLEKIIFAIKDALKSDFAGIIITHGTDTLSFSANLLSLMFCDADVPIVLVSAAYPLDDERTNGFDNFDGAVSFIRKGIPGVFVSYRNYGEDTKIHRGSRLESAGQLDGYVKSLGGEAAFDGNAKENIKGNTKGNAPQTEGLDSRDSGKCFSFFETDILTIRSRALLDYSYYDFDKKKPKAVLVELYHSGTACTKGSSTNLLKFVDYCSEKNVPVIIGPVCSRANVYESMSNIKDKCIIGFDQTFEMITAKVMLSLGSNLDITEILSKDFACEHCE